MEAKNRKEFLFNFYAVALLSFSQPHKHVLEWRYFRGRFIQGFLFYILFLIWFYILFSIWFYILFLILYFIFNFILGFGFHFWLFTLTQSLSRTEFNSIISDCRSKEICELHIHLLFNQFSSFNILLFDVECNILH